MRVHRKASDGSVEGKGVKMQSARRLGRSECLAQGQAKPQRETCGRGWCGSHMCTVPAENLKRPAKDKKPQIRERSTNLISMNKRKSPRNILAGLLKIENLKASRKKWCIIFREQQKDTVLFQQKTVEQGPENAQRGRRSTPIPTSLEAPPLPSPPQQL